MNMSDSSLCYIQTSRFMKKHRLSKHKSYQYFTLSFYYGKSLKIVCLIVLMYHEGSLIMTMRFVIGDF